MDDEKDVRRLLEKMMIMAGYHVDTVSTGSGALEAIREGMPSMVILDLMLPDIDGLTVLKKMKEIEPSLPVIILTGHESVKSAVEAMKLGAYHYMSKPFNNEELVVMTEKAIQASKLEQEVYDLRRQVSKKFSYKNVIGESEKMQKVIKLIMAVADSDVTVLLRGESGTGKELIARTVHNNSGRRKQHFTAIDCASLPETLIEAELFGHEKGAFTGAIRSKPGKFEITNGGTVFLDEIGNIPLTTQAKLLRVLEERCVERLGGTKQADLDVRVLAATNANLEVAMKKGLFRDDLYHRLNEFPIYIPPLRERREDIPIFIDYFIREFNAELGKEIGGVSMGVRGLMDTYDWPGNIREIKNILKRAMLLSQNGIIVAKDLPNEMKNLHIKKRDEAAGEMSLGPLMNLPLKQAAQAAIRQIEKTLIQKVLQEVGGKKTEAARRLGVDEKTLYNKRKEYKL